MCIKNQQTLPHCDIKPDCLANWRQWNKLYKYYYLNKLLRWTSYQPLLPFNYAADMTLICHFVSVHPLNRSPIFSSLSALFLSLSAPEFDFGQVVHSGSENSCLLQQETRFMRVVRVNQNSEGVLKNKSYVELRGNAGLYSFNCAYSIVNWFSVNIIIY